MALVAPVGVHQPKLLTAAAVRHKDDLRAIGRPTGVLVPRPVVVGQLHGHSSLRTSHNSSLRLSLATKTTTSAVGDQRSAQAWLVPKRVKRYAIIAIVGQIMVYCIANRIALERTIMMTLVTLPVRVEHGAIYTLDGTTLPEQAHALLVLLPMQCLLCMNKGRMDNMRDNKRLPTSMK
jgi:hypothetical protein